MAEFDRHICFPVGLPS